MNSIKKIVESLISLNDYSLTKVADTINGAIVYRINAKNRSYILRTNLPENEFSLLINLTPIFIKVGVLVPEIICSSSESKSIIMKDLGDESLLDTLNAKGEVAEVKDLYKQALKNLILMQINGFKEIKLNKAIEIKVYNKDLIKDDLEYFIENYLVAYKNETKNIAKIRDEFLPLINDLANIDNSYFYYRDCMSRNIMNFENNPFFIDFIGGRPEFTGCFKAPLEASVVTLIEHLRAGLSKSFKEELISYYVSIVKNEFNFNLNEKQFLHNYYSFLLIKMLQNLGTYYKHGVFKESVKFSSMIPKTLKELKVLLSSGKLNYSFETLKELIC